ncbi:DUF58 domain-containing protein [Dermatobacter hominis]|uniref:DUF58 domain-containing protein n=1 Tax=Dermatobacter hominis TaxID=2884263 RepID=UPI001D115AA0|nr:DUF58 domain-containing protein [Dermatobacter hominis]UDY37952.1 DUF58 domain-containing protein [Dermatobacter hominis]
MRPGRRVDVASLPPDTRPARRFRVHPTPTGVVSIVALVLFLAIAPAVADPAMAGFVWAALLGLVLVGTAWPCLTVMVVRVEPDADTIGQGPRPVRVGEATSVRLQVGSRLSEVALRWVDAAEAVPLGAGPATEVDVPLVPARRGRFDRLAVRITSDAPFGMVSASRAVVVTPRRPFEVGPRPIDVERLPEPDAGAFGELATTSTGHSGDTTRSVRPYVTGDPAHLVHWPTTARTGELVVREMEPPADRAVAIVVDLGPGPGPVPTGPDELPLMPTTPLREGEDRAAEGAVARSAAIVAELRGRGVRVMLCTAEPQPRVGEVGDDAMAMSRLAAATAGTPGPVPHGWSVLRVTPRGDRG